MCGRHRWGWRGELDTIGRDALARMNRGQMHDPPPFLGTINRRENTQIKEIKRSLSKMASAFTLLGATSFQPCYCKFFYTVVETSKSAAAAAYQIVVNCLVPPRLLIQRWRGERTTIHAMYKYSAYQNICILPVSTVLPVTLLRLALGVSLTVITVN